MTDEHPDAIAVQGSEGAKVWHVPLWGATCNREIEFKHPHAWPGSGTDPRPDPGSEFSKPEFETRPEPTDTPSILDIGCGPNKYPGAVGIDHYPFPGVDIVRDLMRGLPFNDDRFDVVLAKHILEHFAGDDLSFLIEEMYRVSRPGAQWQVVVPDATSPNRYRDPDHKTRDWHEDSFMIWEVDADGNRPIYVGPRCGRRAKLKRGSAAVTQGLDRNYLMEVVK